jgi:hypothetical protein
MVPHNKHPSPPCKVSLATTFGRPTTKTHPSHLSIFPSSPPPPTTVAQPRTHHKSSVHIIFFIPPTNPRILSPSFSSLHPQEDGCPTSRPTCLEQSFLTFVSSTLDRQDRPRCRQRRRQQSDISGYRPRQPSFGCTHDSRSRTAAGRTTWRISLLCRSLSPWCKLATLGLRGFYLWRPISLS